MTQPVATDAHHGHGGSYAVNPDTGERELVERTGCAPAPAPAPANETREPREFHVKAKKEK